MIKCLECQKEFDNESSLHRHLKAHKLSQTVYYQTHMPRYDKYDGSLIRFKNKDYYFSAEFNNRENFKKWFIGISIDEQYLYAKNFLTNRKEKKGLVYAPTQVELQTLMVPRVQYIDLRLGGYDLLCSKIGLKQRFHKKDLDETQFKDISSKYIFKDTREQQPLDFDMRTRTRGMDFGDYRMAGSTIYIERKSLGDAWGTFTGGHERFEREVIRAKEAGAYLVILVESGFETLATFPNQRKVMGRIKMPVEFAYHTIRDLCQKYVNVQFLFVRDRDEASRVIQKIFAADEQVREVDLQLLYDQGKL